jgi:trk system potassium uptake protein TrkH
VFAVLMLSLMITGVDQVTAFSAIAATLNNLGPGLGEVTHSYASLGSMAKWICVFAMLLGRLEIFTLLLLFTVYFWRK